LEANTIVLDSGALSALAEGDEEVREAIREALRAESSIVVPTVVIAESTTGHGVRDAKVNRIVNAVTVVELTEHIARAAASLRVRVPGSGVVDAVVVATADQFAGAAVFTGDARDLKALSLVRGRTRIAAI
jgi:predicted nucleic acid-binding protein